MAKFTPPSGREHPPAAGAHSAGDRSVGSPSTSCSSGVGFTPPSGREHPPAAGAHSPGPSTYLDVSAASNGSQSVTRNQTGNTAPPKR